MSKSEANPKSEIRITTAETGAVSFDSQSDRGLEPRRGCLFIDGGDPFQISFCFSAAARHQKRSNHRKMNNPRADARRFQNAAAKKQKEKNIEADAIYKQATPTGFGEKYRRADQKRGANGNFALF